MWVELTFSCEFKVFHSFRSGRTLSSVSWQGYHAIQNSFSPSMDFCFFTVSSNSEAPDLPGDSSTDPGFMKWVFFWGAFKVDVLACSLYFSAAEHPCRVSEMQTHSLHLKKKKGRWLACAIVQNDKHYPQLTNSFHDLQVPNSKHTIGSTQVLYLIEAFILYQSLTLCIFVMYLLWDSSQKPKYIKGL